MPAKQIRVSMPRAPLLWLTPTLLLCAVSHAVEPKLSLDAAAINNSNHGTISPGNRDSAVARAQILLARAHFSSGEIDGTFGSNLRKTVAAFQSQRNLPVTGSVDGATWAALNADPAPALTGYTVTTGDREGPFVQIPKSVIEQAKLPNMGYSSELEGLAERFHASPALLQALNPGADFGKAGELLTVPNVITAPPGKAASVQVSKSESSVKALGGDGELLAFYVATIGSSHDSLPIGEWTILGVRRNPVYSYDAELFWDAHTPRQKAEIQAGPNNPVGVVWIDLSKEHYGIHGTPDPDMIGHAASHGCIRLTNWDAMELASLVKPGTPAHLNR